MKSIIPDKSIDIKTALSILDTIPHPIVFVDLNHIIQYLNKPAEERYYKIRGFSDLVGKSLFDCHKEISKQQILALIERLKQGEDEIYLKIGKFNEHVTLIAVRSESKELIGYYERFEKVK